MKYNGERMGSYRYYKEIKSKRIYGGFLEGTKWRDIIARVYDPKR